MHSPVRVLPASKYGISNDDITRVDGAVWAICGALRTHVRVVTLLVTLILLSWDFL